MWGPYTTSFKPGLSERREDVSDIQKKDDKVLFPASAHSSPLAPWQAGISHMCDMRVLSCAPVKKKEKRGRDVVENMCSAPTHLYITQSLNEESHPRRELSFSLLHTFIRTHPEHFFLRDLHFLSSLQCIYNSSQQLECDSSLLTLCFPPVQGVQESQALHNSFLTLYLTVELQSGLNYAITSHCQPKILPQLWHNSEHTQSGKHGEKGEKSAAFNVFALS